MRIIITWIVQIITWCSRRLLRHMGRWSRLVREIQPNIRPLFGTRARRLIPENNHGPISKIHILETWKQLPYTTTTRQHQGVDELTETSSPGSPCKHCKTQTPGMVESTLSHS